MIKSQLGTMLDVRLISLAKRVDASVIKARGLSGFPLATKWYTKSIKLAV
jgi:hypothetical protein